MDELKLPKAEHLGANLNLTAIFIVFSQTNKSFALQFDSML